MSDFNDALIARNQDPSQPDSDLSVGLVFRRIVRVAPAEIIATLSHRTVRDSDLVDLDKECSVCMESLQVGDVLKAMPCNHEFHEQCLIRWLQEATSCPLCRFQLESNDINNQITRDVALDTLRRHYRRIYVRTSRRIQSLLNQIDFNGSSQIPINGSNQDDSIHRRHERSRFFGPYYRILGISNRRNQDVLINAINRRSQARSILNRLDVSLRSPERSNRR